MNRANADLFDELTDPFRDDDRTEEHSHLWIVSYSDFMTILMIFFLMCFAHRVWVKKEMFEDRKVQQLRAVQQTHGGMIQRLNKLANVDVQAERIDIHLPEALLFDGGRADLRDSASALLAQIAPDLRNFNGDIVVEGHTDDLPLGPKAKYPSNWELSVARAFSVIHSLEKSGVDPRKLSARGYGPYRPRVANDSPEHRAENRRIEVVLLNPRKST